MLQAVRCFGDNDVHRYWRVFCTSNNGDGSQTCIADLEFHSVVGGSDITGSGTAISGGDGSDVAAASTAFDGNLNAGWARSSATNCWVGYDFGTTVSVAEIQIRPPSVSTDRAPLFGSVDYSDDGVTWTTSFTFAFFPPIAGQSRTFPETIAAGYYRSLRVNAADNNGGGHIGIAEIEFRASVGGADQANGGSARASSEFTVSYTASNAFANNGTASSWVADTAANEWIRYDFPNPVQLAETSIQGYPTSNLSPKNFTIEGSNDGSWVTLFSPPTQTGWTAGEIRTFS